MIVNDSKPQNQRTKLILLEIDKHKSKQISNMDKPLIESLDKRLKFEEELVGLDQRQSPIDEINKFYDSKNTVSFASKVTRFQSIFRV